MAPKNEYILFPWWPEDGDSWLHNADIETARRLLPGQKVFTRTRIEGPFDLFSWTAPRSVVLPEFIGKSSRHAPPCRPLQKAFGFNGYGTAERPYYLELGAVQLDTGGRNFEPNLFCRIQSQETAIALAIVWKFISAWVCSRPFRRSRKCITTSMPSVLSIG